jgi:hypothetical protein
MPLERFPQLHFKRGKRGRFDCYAIGERQRFRFLPYSTNYGGMKHRRVLRVHQSEVGYSVELQAEHLDSVAEAGLMFEGIQLAKKMR